MGSHDRVPIRDSGQVTGARARRHSGGGGGGEEAAGGQRSAGRAPRWPAKIDIEEPQREANSSGATTSPKAEVLTTGIIQERQGEAVRARVSLAEREMECRELRREMERQAHESALLRKELEQARRERASALDENAQLRSQLGLHELQRSRLQHELEACKEQHTKCASQRDKYKRRSVEWLAQIKQIAKGSQHAAAPAGVGGGGGETSNGTCPSPPVAESRSPATVSFVTSWGSAGPSPLTPRSKANLPPPNNAKESPSPVSPRSPAITQPPRLQNHAHKHVFEEPWPEELLPQHVEEGPQARWPASPRDSRQHSPGFTAVESSSTDGVATAVGGADPAGANVDVERVDAIGQGGGLSAAAAAPSTSPSLGDIFVPRQVRGQEHGGVDGPSPATLLEPGAADGSGLSLGELFGNRDADLAPASAHTQGQAQNSQAHRRASAGDQDDELAYSARHVEGRRESQNRSAKAGQGRGPVPEANESDGSTKSPLAQSIEDIKHFDNLLSDGKTRQLMIYKSIYSCHGSHGS